MKRATDSLAAFAFLLATAPLLFSQGVRNNPSPAVPSGILGPQLIAWSQIQQPQPVTEGSSQVNRPLQDQQSGQAQNSDTQQTPRQAPTAQSFMGTIVKNGDRYILKVASNAYQLDDQEWARKYEGKQVKVEGNLGTDGNSLHILGIELIS